MLPDVVPPFVGRYPRQISFLRVQGHHHALGSCVYAVGAPVPNAVHHRVMHPVGLGVPVQQRQHHRLGLGGPGGFRRVHHPRVPLCIRSRQLPQLRLDFLPQALRYRQPRFLRRRGLLPRLVGDAVHPVLQHGPEARLALILRHGPAVLPRLVRALECLPVNLQGQARALIPRQEPPRRLRVLKHSRPVVGRLRVRVRKPHLIQPDFSLALARNFDFNPGRAVPDTL